MNPSSHRPHPTARQAGAAHIALMRPSPLLIPGHTLLRAELLRIVRAGINSSLESAPSRLLFMAWGLGPFSAKLPQEDCQVGGG